MVSWWEFVTVWKERGLSSKRGSVKIHDADWIGRRQQQRGPAAQPNQLDVGLNPPKVLHFRVRVSKEPPPQSERRMEEEVVL